ncbi:hypothetical protein N7E81_11605 [Reichenbachiella carrageenanivorans]|uniref:Terminase ATPase subunit N-terminal domain-containing protein n=1 Tax=Reichenbachiella carrageenanivorans TaxID=2979869 RepID=A0ABY6CVS4_9BACT|nr:helix-turn-helix domain-containing protein [Reichenbachiella carrageenanivorans]UXX78006.1 hypothetical protein N7E81_11605 [Reichenbachiella carrageenanivorans]
MKTEFIEAIQLHNEGYSLEDIAESVEVKQATVKRWIEQHEASLSLAGITEEDEESFTSTLGAIHESNQLKRKELERLDRKEAVQKEKDNRILIKDFQNLCEGIREHVEGSKWNFEEVEKVASKIEDLKGRIEEHFEFNDDVTETNSVFQILGILQDEFEQLKESGPGYSFVFDWARPKIHLLDQALEINDLRNVEFDNCKFEKELAADTIQSTLNGLNGFDGRQVDIDDLQTMEGMLETAQETLESLVEEDLDELGEDIEKIDQIRNYLTELKIRVDESFWKEKKCNLPKIGSEKQID